MRQYKIYNQIDRIEYYLCTDIDTGVLMLSGMFTFALALPVFLRLPGEVVDDYFSGCFSST
jgi:hypothetical protein